MLHEFGIGGDDLEQPEGFGIEFIGVLAHEHPGEPLDGPDRGLEVVGHGVREGLQVLVGRFQELLLRPEVSVQPLQLLLLDGKLFSLDGKLFRLNLEFFISYRQFFGEGLLLR